MKLELYYAPGACSFIPHFALETIKATTGQDWEPKLIKLHKGEQNSPEYKALNPNGQVPTLVVDGTALTQIVAISEFLDQRFPQANLLPRDGLARAQALSDMMWLNNTVHPTFTHYYMPGKFASDETAQSLIKAKAKDDYRNHLARIQKMVETHAKPYFGGAKPNLLDAYAFTLYRWGGIAGIDSAEHAALKAYVDRVAQDSAIAAAVERERIPVHTFKAAT